MRMKRSRNSYGGIKVILMVVILGLSFNQTNGGLLPSSTNLRTGRNLLQRENTKLDDTIRIDPSDNFNKYKGGYDLTNKHYWISTIYTGVYGFGVGVVWSFCGILYGVYLLASICCCNRSNRKLKKKKGIYCDDNKCVLWPILLSTFFTLLAIIATGLVVGGNAKSFSTARKIVDVIINTADEAAEIMFNTTAAMKEISVNLKISNGQAAGFLTSTSNQLNAQAANIQMQAHKQRKVIDKGLNLVYIITTVIISLNLAAVIALSVSGVLKLRRLLHLFIMLCWLLTVLCWLFFGIYFFIEKFGGDTCTAIEEFQRNPNNSSLSSILPCDELVPAQAALTNISAGIYDLVNQVNANISVIQICNPFSPPPEYQYQTLENCPETTIQIRQIPQILNTITCIYDIDSSCNGGIPISSQVYNTVLNYSVSIQNLLYAYPGMESLVECKPVKDGLSEILLHHCKPLRRSVRMVWTSMAFLGIVMMCLVVVSIVEIHNHRFVDGSVKPEGVHGDCL